MDREDTSPFPLSKRHILRPPSPEESGKQAVGERYITEPDLKPDWHEHVKYVCDGKNV